MREETPAGFQFGTQSQGRGRRPQHSGANLGPILDRVFQTARRRRCEIPIAANRFDP